MTNHRLRVIQVESKSPTISRRALYEQAMQTRWEKFWSHDHESTILENERIERTKKILEECFSEKLRIVDLGCGKGILSQFASQKGHEITALDIASNALEHLKGTEITCVQGCLPYLRFSDQAFDGVLCLDVIAELQDNLHRLLVSEFSRLLIPKGWLLCSTPLDLGSWDAYLKFLQLLATEFEIIETYCSYHKLFHFFSRIFSFPSHFLKAMEDSEYRNQMLFGKKWIGRLLFSFLSKSPFKIGWRFLHALFHPIWRVINKSRAVLLFFEKVSQTLWGDQAMTHSIVLARKKSIF